MNNANAGMSSVTSKKLFNSLSNADSSFAKENILLEVRGTPIIKSNGDLPSPIMKNGSPSRTSRYSRADGLKFSLNAKPEVADRKNVYGAYPALGLSRHFDANLDLETFMNVNSPGFMSRVVDKATESASYHIKYPAVRQIPAHRFDKSTLRQLSKIPKANSIPAVRIAPPEPINVELLNTDAVISDQGSLKIRSNDYLQVLKDISRKRNYCQEETDRNMTTPKKSRRNDVKNSASSQFKRAHEDCSNDSIDDKTCKKRCDDIDRNYAKIMSFTSSMSVLVPEFSWSNNSKKRKSSRLDKSKNESPEKMEKCRKIEDDADLEDERQKQGSTSMATCNICDKSEAASKKCEKQSINDPENVDETDSFLSDNLSAADKNEEYIRVAGGKILNRTNCTYRKKLNSTKIDPVSVISTEPEFVNDTVYIDDNVMKENLLNNLVNDIERKGDKNDNVVFYRNSIVEEIERKSTAVEVCQTDSSVLTSSSFNPLLPPKSKLTSAVDETEAPPPSSSSSSSSLKTANSSRPKILSESGTDTRPLSNNVAVTALADSAKNSSNRAPAIIGIVADVHQSGVLANVSSSNSLPQSVTRQLDTQPNVFRGASVAPAECNADAAPSATDAPSSSVARSGPVATVASNVACSPAGVTAHFAVSSGPPGQASPNWPTASSHPALSGTTNLFETRSQHPLPMASPILTLSASASFSDAKLTDMTSKMFAKPAKSGAPPFPTSSGSLFVAPADAVAPITTPTTDANFLDRTASLFGGAVAPAPASVASHSAFADDNLTSRGQFAAFALSSQSAAPAFNQSNGAGGMSAAGAFNTGAATSSASALQPSVFAATPLVTSNASPNPNYPPPSLFSTSAPSAVAPSTSHPSSTQNSLFSTMATQPATGSPSLLFGANGGATKIPPNVQPSIFGSATPSQTHQQQLQQLPVSAAPTSQPQSSTLLFGSLADSSSNVFTQSQSTAPPVGVVNPLPQSIPQFGAAINSSMRFAFGSMSNQQGGAFGAPQPAPTPAPVAAAPVPTPFGAATTTTQLLPFGGGGGGATPAFSFNAAAAATCSFDAPSSNNASGAPTPIFNFGSANAQSTQPAFPFGSAATNASSANSQPFMFGGNVAPAANAGGFSIGSGGSSSRNRSVARTRKAK